LLSEIGAFLLAVEIPLRHYFEGLDLQAEDLRRRIDDILEVTHL